MMPRIACCGVACDDDAYASSEAPANISTAPPSTVSHRRAPALRSSLNSVTPQKMPMRLFMFHSGKAMLSPTSRMAKMVRVLATAQRHPASTAHTTRCGAWRRSHPTCPVPRTSAGTLQRARNTPATISNEMTTGEIPSVTSLAGASAAPSHAPAPKPQRMPSDCSCRRRSGATAE